MFFQSVFCIAHDYEQNHSPVEAIRCLRQWPSEANNSKQSPLEAKTMLNEAPIVVEPVEAQINANDNHCCLIIEYKELYQGRVNYCDDYNICENDGPYVSLRSALMNHRRANNRSKCNFVVLKPVKALVSSS